MGERQHGHHSFSVTDTKSLLTTVIKTRRIPSFPLLVLLSRVEAESAYRFRQPHHCFRLWLFLQLARPSITSNVGSACHRELIAYRIASWDVHGRLWTLDPPVPNTPNYCGLHSGPLAIPPFARISRMVCCTPLSWIIGFDVRTLLYVRICKLTCTCRSLTLSTKRV